MSALLLRREGAIDGLNHSAEPPELVFQLDIPARTATDGCRKNVF